MDKKLKESIQKLIQSDSHEIGVMQWYSQGGTTDELIEYFMGYYDPKMINRAMLAQVTLGMFMVEWWTNSNIVFLFTDNYEIPDYRFESKDEFSLFKNLKLAFEEMLELYLKYYKINILINN